jgi:hypothetical protein
MKKLLFFFGFWAAIVAYSCQKETSPLVGETDYSSLSVGDRGGKGKGHHPKDSCKHDTTKHHHDTLKMDTIKKHHGHHHDSIKIHHPQDTTGCHVAPVKLTLVDLPQAAKDWIAANKAGIEILSVVKITKKDCSVYYHVRFKASAAVRFDVNGNKL